MTQNPWWDWVGVNHTALCALSLNNNSRPDSTAGAVAASLRGFAFSMLFHCVAILHVTQMARDSEPQAERDGLNQSELCILGVVLQG